MKSEYKIMFTWDDEACVWIATSDDIQSLVLEHDSFDTLMERVRTAVPELLEMEGLPCGNVSLDYCINRKERLAANG